MDVQSFITETLVQICNGVANASTNLANTDAIINPKGIGIQDNAMFVHEDMRRTVQNVEFDIAVTATEGSGTEGGAGLMVGVIGLGTRGRSDTENTSTSRIRFTVPIALPVSPTD